MKIAISDPDFSFSFFYVLSFVITFFLIIVFSKRLKIPLWSVLLMLTTVSLSTIVGSRLSTIPVSEWGQIISTGIFEGYPGRFAVGGLLFGLAGLILSIKFLGLDRRIINIYAWITPLGFGIQKIGCFLNGCCYGKPSDLPWSIQYPIGTNAHFHHWVNGMIGENSVYSLSLHPVQLYEVICLFTIAYIVWRTQKFWKKTYSSLIFALYLFFIFRFAIEFLRDPAASNFNNTLILGFRVLQWFFLTSAFICGIILILYEKRLRPIIHKFPKAEPSLKTSIIFVISVSAIIYVFRGLFTPFELLSLYIKFIPAIVLAAYHVFKALKTVRFRLATTSFFVLPLFLIIQTISPDSVKVESVRNFYQDEVKSYKRIDFNTSLGNYYNTMRYNPIEGECGTSYTEEDYKYLYRVAGAGFSSIKKNEKSITTTGFNLYGGVSKETNLAKQWEKSYFIAGVNPYFKYDLNWFGFGIGAHIGNIRWVPGSPIDKTSFDKGTRFSPFMPEVLLRVGRRDIIDLKYTYGFNLPTSIPVLLNELSIGSGFGSKSEFSLRFGGAISKYNTYPFISAEGLLNKQLGFTFKYNFGNGDLDYLSSNEVEKRNGRILFGVNYRFGFKK